MAAGIAYGQVRKVVPNQVTVGWDAVTTLQNGNPVPAGDLIKYEIYLADYPVAEADRENPAAHTLLGETDAVEWLVTLQNEGNYAVGIRSIRYVDGDTVDPDKRIENGFGWSDIDGVPVPWYLSYFIPAAKATGIYTK